MCHSSNSENTSTDNCTTSSVYVFVPVVRRADLTVHWLHYMLTRMMCTYTRTLWLFHLGFGWLQMQERKVHPKFTSQRKRCLCQCSAKSVLPPLYQQTHTHTCIQIHTASSFLSSPYGVGSISKYLWTVRENIILSHLPKQLLIVFSMNNRCIFTTCYFWGYTLGTSMFCVDMKEWKYAHNSVILHSRG